MAEDPTPEINRTKIRIGLALISLVVIAALVLVFVVEAPAGKAVMFAIAVTAFARAFLLSRSLRQERGSA